MISGFLIKGCIIGFSIAMPVGPIGLLCIRNSLARGMFYGFVTGLGAACADTLYGALGGFGMSALGLFLTDYHLLLEFLGALFLCYLGVSTFFEKVCDRSVTVKSGGHLKTFFSTFLLTLTNPLTIFSFTGIYAGLGLDALSDDLLAPLIITIGVFLGSIMWWLLLCVVSARLKEKVGNGTRKWLNRISGSIIFGFGFTMLFRIIIIL